MLHNCARRSTRATLNRLTNLKVASSNIKKMPNLAGLSRIQYASNRVPSYYDRYVFPEPPELISSQESKTVLSKVNECIEESERLFAIVDISANQFKVTTHDLILVNGYLPAKCGDVIRLEKVLLVGGKEFSLVGRPLLKRSTVKVEATVLEKTPGMYTIVKKFKRASNFERTHKSTSQNTILRINCIEVNNNLS